MTHTSQHHGKDRNPTQLESTRMPKSSADLRDADRRTARVREDAERWSVRPHGSAKTKYYLRMEERAREGDNHAKDWVRCADRCKEARLIESKFTPDKLKRAQAGAEDALKYIGYYCFHSNGVKMYERCKDFLKPEVITAIETLRSHRDLRREYFRWFHSGESHETFWSAFGKYSGEAFKGLGQGLLRIPATLWGMGKGLLTSPRATINAVAANYSKTAGESGHAAAVFDLLTGNVTLAKSCNKSLKALDSLEEAQKNFKTTVRECKKLEKAGCLTKRDIQRLKEAEASLRKANKVYSSAHENLVRASGSAETAALLIVVGPKIAKGAAQGVKAAVSKVPAAAAAVSSVAKFIPKRGVAAEPIPVPETPALPPPGQPALPSGGQPALPSPGQPALPPPRGPSPLARNTGRGIEEYTPADEILDADFRVLDAASAPIHPAGPGVPYAHNTGATKAAGRQGGVLDSDFALLQSQSSVEKALKRLQVHEEKVNELEELKNSGEISVAEYRQRRAALAAQWKAAFKRK